MGNRFSDTLAMIQKRLPYWMKAPRRNDSLAADFLNVFGLALDDVQYVIDYAYKQMYIDRADVNQIDSVYKAFIPATINTDYRVAVMTDEFTMIPVSTLEDFFMALDTDVIHSEIQFPNPFLIDYEKHIIYVREPYDISDSFTEGKIRVAITGPNGLVFDQQIPLVYHPVWNFFDEFGLLLATPRISKETNLAYKDRIMDVFKHLGNASKTGLMNGIARGLGLRTNKIWQDGSKDYTIIDRMVVINSIEADGVLIDACDVYTNVTGDIVIKGNPAYNLTRRELSYISGLEMHALHNKEDMVLQSQIDTPDKPVLQYILERINSEAPIMWGYFIWDEAFWDVVDDTSGHVAPKLDASFQSRQTLPSPQLKVSPQALNVERNTGLRIRLYRLPGTPVEISKIIPDISEVTLSKESILKFI